MLRHIVLPLAIGLSACTALVPSTVGRLMALSPLTADPEAIALRVTLPDGTGIMPGSAKMILETTGGIEKSGTFILARQGDVFSVAPNDVDRLRTLQAEIAAVEATNPNDISGSLGITAGPCVVGEGPTADSRLSVGMRLAVDGPFLPLVRNGPLSAMFDETDIATWPTCPTP